MRNEVAASHPNVESIGGFELMGWLQTCVKSVLQDRPSDSAIRIKSFIGNIRERTTVIDEHTKIRFGEELKNLSLPHVHNLLITFFGIFASQKTDQILRKNISIIAPFIWDHSEDRVKYRIGSMIDGYRTNLDEVKLNHGLDFLAVVDGKAYESLPARTVALQNLAIALKEAHNGWDNFYNEPSPMRDILSYCKKSTDIPKELMPTLIPVVLSCRLGRGLSFSGGVSPSGKDLYDQFLKLLDDDGVVQCIISLFGRELNSKLSNPICQNHLGSVIEILKGVTISDRLEDALDFLLDDLSNAHRAHKNQDFQALTKAYIKWN